MGDAGFKGVSAEQDSRFSNKHKKLLKSMKFPPEFDQKVDMKKVNLDVLKPWISEKIKELLGFDDEFVIDYTFGLLEEDKPDPKNIQINLQGFLDEKTQPFILELWNLLLSAQSSVGGIPKAFLDEKKEELRRKREEEIERKAQQEAVMNAIRRVKESDKEGYSSSASPSPREGDNRASNEKQDNRSYRRRSRSRSQERRSSSRRDRDSYSSRSSRRYSRNDDDRSHRRHRSRSRDGYSSGRRHYHRSPTPERDQRSRDDSRDRKRRRSSRDDDRKSHDDTRNGRSNQQKSGVPTD